MWVNLWKKEIDKKEPFGYSQFQRSYKQIFFNLEWYEVYDLVEFIVKIDKTRRGVEFKKSYKLYIGEGIFSISYGE